MKGSSGNTFEGYGIWYDQKGYPSIWMGDRSVRLHVFVWEREHGLKPKGHDIHHKDFNKGNYSLDNLVLLTHPDHQKVHAGWLKTNGEWTHKPCTKCRKVLPLDQFYPRKGYVPTPLCKKCHCEKTKEWSVKNPDKRKKIARDYVRRHKLEAAA
jgi:hypothetical protein